jgi:hypothetical protein
MATLLVVEPDVKTFEVTTIDDCVIRLVTLYHDSEVVFGEFIATIEIIGFNLDQVQSVIAKARKIVDGYGTLIYDSDLYNSANLIDGAEIQIIE